MMLMYSARLTEQGQLRTASPMHLKHLKKHCPIQGTFPAMVGEIFHPHLWLTVTKTGNVAKKLDLEV